MAVVKGRPGCFRCGAPTVRVVQLWLRDYVEGTKDKHGSRKQRTVHSVTRAYCEPHGAETLTAILLLLARNATAYHGCARCGTRTTVRIQTWMRTTAGASVRAKSSSYCEPCGDAVYLAAGSILDIDTYRENPRTVPSTGLVAARAARAALRGKS